MLSVKPKVVTDLFLLPFFPTPVLPDRKHNRHKRGHMCKLVMFMQHASLLLAIHFFDGIKMEKLTKQQSKIFSCCKTLPFCKILVLEQVSKMPLLLTNSNRKSCDLANALFCSAVLLQVIAKLLLHTGATWTLQFLRIKRRSQRPFF